MTEDRQKAAAQVNALRALEQGARRVKSLAEAKAAFAAAQRLILKHNLREADLNRPSLGLPGTVGDQRVGRSTVYVWPEEDGVTPWAADLALILAEQNQCAGLIDYLGDDDDGSLILRGVRVYGRRADIDNVRRLLRYMVAEVERLATEAAESRRRSRAWREDFFEGALNGVEDAIKRETKKERREATSTALAVLRDYSSAAVAALSKDFPDSEVETSQSSIRHADAFDAGRKAGRGLHRGHALPGKTKSANKPLLLKG